MINYVYHIYYRDEALDALPRPSAEASSKPLPRVSAARYIRAMDARGRERSMAWMPESVTLLLGKEEEEGHQPGVQARQALRKILKPAVRPVTGSHE